MRTFPLFTIDSPTPLFRHKLPVYDLFHTRGRYIGMVAPYYTRVALRRLRVSIDGRIVGCWKLPDPREFTASIMAEIPGALRGKESWHVQVQYCGHVIHQQRVARLPYRGRLAAATLCKYDWPYLDEWIDYHHQLGFEHFYIYNNGEPRITRAMHRHLASGTATEIPWPYSYKLYSAHWEPFWPPDSHHYTQPPQQMHALLKYGDSWEWIGLFDADEFVVPMTDEPLIETLDRASVKRDWCEYPYLRCAGVEMEGKWFGSSGHSGEAKSPVVRNYTKCEQGHTAGTKWIARPACVDSTAVHYCETTKAQPARVATNILRYNHYRAISAHRKRCMRADHAHYSNETTDTRLVEVQRGLT